LSHITHDLRAPLCAIMGYLDLVSFEVDKSNTPKAVEYLSLAREASQRMQRMVNDMLEMFRVESGNNLLQRKPLTLDSLFHAVKNTFGGLADLNNIRLQCVPPDRVSVWADPRYLGRVLDNLVSNALKFTPPGGFVEVVARRDADRVTFEVNDTGRGIPADQQKKIFERFQHVQTSDHRLGFGIGLSVAKAIVMAHGGEIRVESHPGKGSRFIFWIPDAPAKAA
jgi:two-component system sensor histidine kinase VicK